MCWQVETCISFVFQNEEPLEVVHPADVEDPTFIKLVFGTGNGRDLLGRDAKARRCRRVQ